MGPRAVATSINLGIEPSQKVKDAMDRTQQTRANFKTNNQVIVDVCVGNMLYNMEVASDRGLDKLNKQYLLPVNCEHEWQRLSLISSVLDELTNKGVHSIDVWMIKNKGHKGLLLNIEFSWQALT
jgi:hypothetical protein